MYRTLDSTRGSDLEEDANSSGSSFWSDQESEAEDGQHHAAEEESEEEVLERCVSEQPGGTRQDKPSQLGKHDNQTQGRQQSRKLANNENEEPVGERNVLKESDGTRQDKSVRLEKCVRAGDHQQTQGSEQSGESANAEDEKSVGERRDNETEMKRDCEEQTENNEDDSESSDEDHSESSDEAKMKSDCEEQSEDHSESSNEGHSESSNEGHSKSSGEGHSESSNEGHSKSSDEAKTKSDCEEQTETDDDHSKFTDEDHSKSADEDHSKFTDEDHSKSSDEDHSKSADDHSKSSDQDHSESTDEAKTKSDCEEQTETDDDHSKSADEAKMKSGSEGQIETDEDQNTFTDDVKEDSEKVWKCNNEEEQQKANTHHPVTEDTPAVETANKFLPSTESEEDASSFGSSFWSDRVGEPDDGRHHAVEESDEEVLERYVLEAPGDACQDKSIGQLGEQARAEENHDQTQDRQQSLECDNTEDEETVGQPAMMEESARTLQDKPGQSEKCARAGGRDDQTPGREQSGESANAEDEESVAERSGNEAKMKSDWEEQTQKDDCSKSTDGVKEYYKDNKRCSSEKEQQKVDSHQSNTYDRPMVETAFKFVTSAEKAKTKEAQAQRHWYERENVRICMEEDQGEKDADQDYPIAASPTSVITSGYGTYRPDSPRDTADGEAFRDDITLTDPEEDSDVGQFDAQYYVDNYRLSMKDNEFSSNVMLCDDIGNTRNQSKRQALPGYSNNSTGVDHKYVGLCVVSDCVGVQCSVDGSHLIDKAIEEESEYRDNQFSELRKQYSRKSYPAFGVKDVSVCEENDFTSLSESHEHPFNLRQNKWKYYQRRKLKGTEYIRKKSRHKKSGVSGLEECLDRLQMSEMRRRQEMDSEELESLSSGGELPSAFRAYFKGIVRSRSESDIRPRPKSFIRPLMDHPHTRNLKKTDPVTKYFQYKEEWDAFKAPGEKDRRALRWEIREQLAYQPPPPRPQKVLIPNTYVVPTDKKRSALRWEIRHDLANGIIPTKMALP